MTKRHRLLDKRLGYANHLIGKSWKAILPLVHDQVLGRAFSTSKMDTITHQSRTTLETDCCILLNHKFELLFIRRQLF